MLTLEQLRSAFALADAAKAKEQYAVANVVFAVVVDHLLALGGGSEVELFYATDDPTGEHAGSLDQLFFDLVGLRLRGQNGEVEASLVIPVPLVGDLALLALKRGPVEERGRHDRRTTPATPKERAALWAELWELAPPAEAGAAARQYLRLDAVAAALVAELARVEAGPTRAEAEQA